MLLSVGLLLLLLVLLLLLFNLVLQVGHLERIF